MKNFLRAIREGIHHWPALLLAIGCSLGVAILWGANIAALFPLIQATLSGNSLQESYAERLDGVRAELVVAKGELADLRQIEVLPGTEEYIQVKNQIELLEMQQEIDEATLSSGEWTLDLMEAWLPSGPFATVGLVVCLLFAGTILRVLLMVLNVTLIAHVTHSTVRDLRQQIFSKALELDRPGFEAMGISGFQAQITHITDMLAAGMTSFYGGAITEPLRIIACLAGALYVSWQLTVASLLLAPIAVFLVFNLNRGVRQICSSLLDRSLNFHHVLHEVLNGHQTVQANTMEPVEKVRFDEATQEMKRIAMRFAMFNSMSSPITEFFGIGMLCIGILTSTHLVLNQETTIFGIKMCDEPLSIPTATVFFGLLIGAADPLRKLSGVVNGINNGMAAAGILYPTLDRESALHELDEPLCMPEQIESIELSNVDFSYDGVQPVLKEVSITINRYDRVAIIGANGTGKSTLANLICRNYDPQQGSVSINGIPLTSLSIRELRSRFALVTQETELFNESILHNIRYGRWEATMEEVVEAARKARAHDFINELPNGYETIVGSNGQRLSGGQRQRIALARAFLRDAEVLILDEATSQIDVESEQLIHEALASYCQDKTILFITHRESTLSLATRTICVKDLNIQELDRNLPEAA